MRLRLLPLSAALTLGMLLPAGAVTLAHPVQCNCRHLFCRPCVPKPPKPRPTPRPPLRR